MRQTRECADNNCLPQAPQTWKFTGMWRCVDMTLRNRSVSRVYRTESWTETRWTSSDQFPRAVTCLKSP